VCHAVQVAHAAVVQLLEWLPHSFAISGDLLSDALAVLGATASCASEPGAAQALTAALKGMKERLPPRLMAGLKPRLQAAMVRVCTLVHVATTYISSASVL
jgi:hypothetical protein